MLKNEKHSRIPAKWKLNRDYRRYKHSLTRTETFLNRHMSLNPNTKATAPNKETAKSRSPESRLRDSALNRFDTRQSQQKSLEKKVSSRNIRRLLSLNKGLVEKSAMTQQYEGKRTEAAKANRARDGRSRKNGKSSRNRGKSGRRVSVERGKSVREKSRAKRSQVKRKRKMDGRLEKSRSRKSNSRNYRSKYDVDERLEYYMTRKLGKGSYATVYLGMLYLYFLVKKVNSA